MFSETGRIVRRNLVQHVLHGAGNSRAFQVPAELHIAAWERLSFGLCNGGTGCGCLRPEGPAAVSGGLAGGLVWQSGLGGNGKTVMPTKQPGTASSRFEQT